MTPSLARIAASSALAAVGASAINVVLAVGATVALGIPADFEPLAVSAVVIASVAGAVSAGACFAVLSRFLPRPVPVFLAVAGVALLASMYPPIGLILADPPQYPGTSLAAVATLMVMHLVVTALSVGLLIRGRSVSSALVQEAR